MSDERIGKFSYGGLPDIRVVVHNLIPVMAMLRLPTKESGGKANLHMGAVGVGIDIAKGQATHIVYKNRIIQEIPGGLGRIKGLKIPYWDEILLIASKTQLVTNLGYLAADICIDKNSGPVLLEINARAGLALQIANLAPLRKRLERIRGIKVTSPTKGVRIGKDIFGVAPEVLKKPAESKKIISTEEIIEIINKNSIVKIKAKIDTGRSRSLLDKQTAIEKGLIEISTNPPENEEKTTARLKLSIKGLRLQSIFDIEDLTGEYKVIIGRRDLTNFLIDPSLSQSLKVPTTTPPQIQIKTSPQQELNELNDKIIEIDSKIKLLHHLAPINLQEEKEKFLKNPEENPQFIYPNIKFNSLELVNDISALKFPDNSTGQLFKRKAQEISHKIALIEAIDQEEFTNISIQLFGKPTSEHLQLCYKNLPNITSAPETNNCLEALEIKERIEKCFKNYGLNNWHVKISEKIVSRFLAGKNSVLSIRKDTQISEEKLKSIIIHEIETHILTAENGKTQPYTLFNRGLANYLETQEGLAVYNVEANTGENFIESSAGIINIIAIELALSRSFSETYEELTKIGIQDEKAFRYVLRAKRGFCDTSQKGAFTKDNSYVKGYYQVKNFIQNGGDIHDLYIGKFNLDDLPIIKQIPELKAPKYLPTWLKSNN